MHFCKIFLLTLSRCTFAHKMYYYVFWRVCSSMFEFCVNKCINLNTVTLLNNAFSQGVFTFLRGAFDRKKCFGRFLFLHYSEILLLKTNALYVTPCPFSALAFFCVHNTLVRLCLARCCCYVLLCL